LIAGAIREVVLSKNPAKKAVEGFSLKRKTLKELRATGTMFSRLITCRWRSCNTSRSPVSALSYSDTYLMRLTGNF
jgi:hypothetical protein